ncbi:MAG: molecular chaperone HtpG, partial [Prevotella sp.]|nr:molecular chaperone HtpG [Prevotella sp.]
PDIPQNVSRSYLQSDKDVKKISTYITKKVADRLSSIFKENRKEYEEKWDDLKIFIHYGMLSQEDFYDRAKDFCLLKDVEGKYFTLDEYRTLIQGEQTDKDGNVVYLYANDKEEQYSYIEAAKAKGYSVLLMDGQLDTPTVSMFEQKLEKSRFTRVDGDIIERLIVKEDTPKNELDEKQTDNLSEAFRTQMPKLEKVEFNVEVQSLGEQAQPVLITQSEYMRRMKDMSRYQPGMSFYSQMPDTYQLVLNASHPLIKRVLDTVKDKEKDSIAEVAKENPVISQLIDLALLQNGMLKGASLDAFLKRSVELIK